MSFQIPPKRELFREFAAFLSNFLRLPQEEALIRKLELLSTGKKRPLLWLQLLDCAGCTEKLLRTSEWRLLEFLLELVDLRYHELLMFETGEHAERILREAYSGELGSFILLVEGAIPYRDRGAYLKFLEISLLDFLSKISEKAELIIAFGNCATQGGIPATPPSPTCAIGLPTLLGTERVISIFGCPGKSKTLVALLSHYLLFDRLPALDRAGRPRI